MTSPDAAQMHKAAIVIDATCPLANRTEFLDDWVAGGATAIAPSLDASGGADRAIRGIARWLGVLAQHPTRLLHVTRADDVLRAKREGKLGIIFHFQNADPVEDDLSLLSVYQRLGIRMIQLTYNRKNRVGDGCEERTDAGLSRFGVRLIKEMNRLGIVVDLSHTGYRTTMDAIECSAATPVFSHSNCKAICESPRNITDDQIRAVAQRGGLIGMNGYPAFVAKVPRPTLDQFVAHIEHITHLVGPDHVGLGIDYYEGMAGIMPLEQAAREYDRLIASGIWTSAAYPPPPWHYPEGLERPSGLPTLTVALAARGYSVFDIQKIMGGNWLRVFGQVWGGSWS